MFRLLTLFSMCLISHLSAMETLTFDQLEKYTLEEAKRLEGQLITITGFATQEANGDWMIRDRPNAPCCARKNRVPIKRQMCIDAPLTHISKDKPMQVIGTFHVNPEKDPQGRFTKMYRLKDAKTPTIPSSSKWPLYAIILPLPFAILIMRRFLTSGRP